MQDETDNKQGLVPREYTKEEARVLIDTDPDFIYSKAHGYSLKKLLADRKDGVPESQIAKFLLLSPDEVEQAYQDGIAKIRTNLGVEIKDPAKKPAEISKEQAAANRTARERPTRK